MRVKDPSARQIKAALSVLAYFAIAADMGNDEARALAYAKAAAQLEAELVRVPQAAARAARLAALSGDGPVLEVRASVGTGA